MSQSMNATHGKSTSTTSAEPMTAPARRGGFFSRSPLGRTLWSFKRELFWVGVFSCFANLLMITPSLYMLQVFDRVMLSGSGLTLIALTLIATLLFATMAFAEWVRSRLLVRAGVRFDQQLNASLFSASFEASLKGSAGGKPLQAFADLAQLRQFLTGNGVFTLFDTPWTVVYVAVLFMMHPWLGYASLGFAAVMVCLALWTRWLTSAKQSSASDSLVETNAYLAAKLRNSETVEVLGMLGNLRRQWLALHEKQLDAQGRATDVAQRAQALVKYVQYSQQSLMLALGALLVVKGELGVGAMVASNMLVTNALRPIGALVGTWRQFTDARQSYGRLETLLQEHPPRTALHESDQVLGQISLRGLQASAKARPTPILKGLDAEFVAGEVVAIIGPSGAGKSTLARCLVGIWPETQGKVLLDGHGINDWSREVLGPHIGYLPQDIELFEGSIAENIARFGELDSQQVIDAAKRTGIHDMVLRFPKGYDTSIGEAGNLLSGGQRQRIGLARALYGNPKLVVLDEPNANLDDVGELALMRAVQDLRQGGSTVFMVVHLRQMLAIADRVLVLQDGTIAQLARVTPQGAAPAAPTAAAPTAAPTAARTAARTAAPPTAPPAAAPAATAPATTPLLASLTPVKKPSA